ncbi:metallophosphoesterase [Pseudoroseomonas wenyumeiae]|uniref:Metallophosphoesterase n=1 Tax=Teichococcus wenyumeiae TaxID=2478470 RepID=A0A3A9JEW8_9PROT|nr:metallophosphoesterase [Pseudoroseomonas wenyumeiae]RKK02166.1 metallophosphoesterase [Pseudoroseomonas wenyumeiae]RMI26844.1 metallophosphoesterase [Pseudoroseomonas wenyumeiae]
MPFRIAQISDTHLSEKHPGFTANFDALAAHLRAAAPDLVVHTGDVSAHGELAGDDLRFARRKLDAMGLPWLAIPGNHDVGNDPGLGDTPADAERLARWEDAMGADRFVFDVPGWRLIGLDTLITTSGLPEAEAQMEMLAEALADAGERAVALFLHKPLCEEAMAEEVITYWSVQPGPRRRILDLLRACPPAFIASGHVHQWRDRGVVEGLRQIWAPAAAFVVGDTWQHRAPGAEKPVGYVEHVLHEDGRHECRLVRPAGLQCHDLGLLPGIYAPMRPLEAAE